jgi:hypothetical protein
MPTKTQQNVRIRAGETRPIQITVRDEDGVDLDLSNATLIYRIARHGRTTSPHYLLSLTEADDRLTVEDNGSGTDSIVRYDPGLLDLVVPGKHTHSLRVTQTGGDARVVMVGSFVIDDEITSD